MQSEWSVLGINDTKTHKTLQCATSKLKARSNRRLDYWEMHPKSPLLHLLLIIIADISHFQLHLQPVLCGEGLLNQSCSWCWASLYHCTYHILIAFCPFSSFNLAHLHPSVLQLRQWQRSRVNTNITAGVAHRHTHRFCISGVCLLVYESVRLFFFLSLCYSDHRIMRLNQFWFPAPAEIGLRLTPERWVMYDFEARAGSR